MPANDERDESHGSDEIRATVAADLPDAEVQEVTPVEEGKNSVYRVTAIGAETGMETEIETGNETGTETETGTGTETGAADREFVLKVGDYHFSEGCRAEPHLLDAVAERTKIPVPTVCATGHLREDPYFLAEAVSGLNLAGDPGRLDPGAFEQICLDAGRHLAELHAAFPADGWGLLGLERGGDDLQFVREFPDWPSNFEAWLNHNVERLEDTRFADLVPALTEQVSVVIGELREHGPFDPVITHGDYRLGNLLVDPETGATNAVIDWATPTAAPPTHDLAVTEAILLDWPEFDDDRQRRLRERLYEGYREENSEVLDRDEFEAHRRLCRFGARLRLMINLEEEMAGRTQATVDARARKHREALRAHGVE